MTEGRWKSWRMAGRRRVSVFILDTEARLPDFKPAWLEDLVCSFFHLMKRGVCLIWGHVPIQDQCRIPEHDYCATCSASQPGLADRPGPSADA